MTRKDWDRWMEGQLGNSWRSGADLPDWRVGIMKATKGDTIFRFGVEQTTTFRRVDTCSTHLNTISATVTASSSVSELFTHFLLS